MPDTVTLPALTQIGTVEVTRTRVYPLPGAKTTDTATAQVPPGHYPVLRQSDGAVFWLMSARRSDVEVSATPIESATGGMFALSANDKRPQGKPFMITSPVFPAGEFADFAADAALDPASPVRFTLTESA